MNGKNLSSNKDIRVRFAPAPTGKLHLGSARTALFNWLFARSTKGTYVLRIEDTDRTRSTIEYEKSILEDLRWIGLLWDEGPDVGGTCGPYYQSERQALYQEKARVLLEKGLAYHCYCTEEELEERRHSALAQGKMPKYDGRCCLLKEEEKKHFQVEGRKPALRFKVPEEEIQFDDLIRGRVEFSPDVIGDFIIMRSEGIASFNFAVVIDDGEMKISHVIRGEDHLTNTARHILLFNALGYLLPRFAHISMLFGTDGTKLSKRHGATSVGEYRKMGYLPQALNNYLALLGWSSPDGREIFELEELSRVFTLERMSRSPAIFDIDKLNWINHQHFRKLAASELAELAVPYLAEAGYIREELTNQEREKVEEIVLALRDGLSTLSEIKEMAKVFYEEVPEMSAEAKDCIKKAPREIFNTFIELIEMQTQISPEKAKIVLQELANRFRDKNIKGKNLFFPLRAVLTGKLKGPELFQIIGIIGKEMCKIRIKAALSGL